MSLISITCFASLENSKILHHDIWARQVLDLPSTSRLRLYQKPDEDIGILYSLSHAKGPNNKDMSRGVNYEISFFSGIKRQLSNEQWRFLIDDKALIANNVITPFLPNSWESPDDTRDKIFLKDAIIQVVIENNSQMRADQCPNAPYDAFIRKMDMNGNVMKEVVVLILNGKSLPQGVAGECSSYLVTRPKLNQNIMRRVDSPFPNLFAIPLNDDTFLYYGNNIVLRLTSDLTSQSTLLNNQIFLLPRQEVKKIWDETAIKRFSSDKKRQDEWDDVAGEEALYQYLTNIAGEHHGK